MYSKNDYRDYLEHRLAESDDFLAHYGVKGMKWRKRKGSSVDEALESLGRRSYLQKNANQLINTTNRYKWNSNKSIGQNIERNYKVMQRRRKLKKLSSNGIKSVDQALSGRSSKKTAKKKPEKSIFDKSVWKRSKPKGKRLSKKSNIYVSHN